MNVVDFQGLDISSSDVSWKERPKGSCSSVVRSDRPTTLSREMRADEDLCMGNFVVSCPAPLIPSLSLESG